MFVTGPSAAELEPPTVTPEMAVSDTRTGSLFFSVHDGLGKCVAGSTFLTIQEMKSRVVLTKSNREGKRMKAEFENKTIHFGLRGGSTFIDHGDQKTKENWIKRHKVKSSFNKYDTAGALAKHILWNKNTLNASVKDLNKRQNQYKFILPK